jgi:hypothetical protein
VGEKKERKNKINGFLITRSSPKASFLLGRGSVCHNNKSQEPSGCSGASTEEGS